MKKFHVFRRMGAVLLLWSTVTGAQEPVDLLPDIIVNPTHLQDWVLVTNVEAGRWHVRFSNGTPNIGDGKLYVYGVEPAKGDGHQTQEVRQRVFRSDGSYTDRAAGQFTYHPSHNHTHLDDWALYRLREVTEDNGIGAIVATGSKVSFCLLDTSVYDDSLPNYTGVAEFRDCSFGVQGISVGYEDVYQRFLPDQWIDVTDIPDGTYWLESVVDPENHILEKDDSNNAARIQITIDKGDDEGPPPPSNGLIAFLVALFQRIIEILLGLFGGPN